MPKNKFKTTNPTNMLEAMYGLDREAINVLRNHLDKLKIMISLEDNILYATDGNGMKFEVNKHDYILSKINELKKFEAGEDNNSLLMYYLQEKIRSLENKIRDLESENDTLRERMSEYHD